MKFFSHWIPSCGPSLCSRLLIAVALQGGESTKEPIRIGFVARTSSPVADLGLSGRDAVELIAKQFNSNGGIASRKIDCT